MTMIVFDGTHFWTDGRSSMRNRNLGKTMDLDHRQKLTLLHTPIVTSCGVKFTAIAGTGVSDDVKLIMEEVSRSAKAGETMQYMSARMEILLSSKTSCHVVGVGGVISRYNPITGKLDHPKPYSEKRQRALFDKWKEYKMKEFNDKVAHCNKVLDLRFPKVEEKK